MESPLSRSEGHRNGRGNNIQDAVVDSSRRAPPGGETFYDGLAFAEPPDNAPTRREEGMALSLDRGMWLDKMDKEPWT